MARRTARTVTSTQNLRFIIGLTAVDVVAGYAVKIDQQHTASGRLIVDSVRISAHAISSYRERVEDATEDEILLLLDTPAVRWAASQQCRIAVRLGTGQRIIIKNGTIITILPKDSRGLY